MNMPDSIWCAWHSGARGVLTKYAGFSGIFRNMLDMPGSARLFSTNQRSAKRGSSARREYEDILAQQGAADHNSYGLPLSTREWRREGTRLMHAKRDKLAEEMWGISAVYQMDGRSLDSWSIKLWRLGRPPSTIRAYATNIFLSRSIQIGEYSAYL
jgi:hypothetical protein